MVSAIVLLPAAVIMDFVVALVELTGLREPHSDRVAMMLLGGGAFITACYLMDSSGGLMMVSSPTGELTMMFASRFSYTIEVTTNPFFLMFYTPKTFLILLLQLLLLLYSIIAYILAHPIFFILISLLALTAFFAG